MNLSVIQYVRPEGREREESIKISDNYAIHVAGIKACGLRVTAEVLTTGECSFTLEYPEQACDFDIELSKNGPGPDGTKAAIERLIERFDHEKFVKWKKQIDAEDDGLGVGWGT